MTTIKRFTPDYKMHAVRFEAFAREAEHGEYVQFDAHQQVVSALEAERDALERQLSMSEAKCKGYFSDAAAALVRCDSLAVENAAMRSVIDAAIGVANNSSGIAGWHLNGEIADWDEILPELNIETPATDAALAAIRDKHRAEGITFAANRLLAAFKHGFIDKPAGEVADVAKMILSAVTELPGAPEEGFTRDYSDEVIALIRAELREAK